MEKPSLPPYPLGMCSWLSWRPETADSTEPLYKRYFPKQAFHWKGALYGFFLADPNCQPQTLALWGPDQVNQGDLVTSAAISAPSSRRWRGDEWRGGHVAQRRWAQGWFSRGWAWDFIAGRRVAHHVKLTIIYIWNLPFIIFRHRLIFLNWNEGKWNLRQREFCIGKVAFWFMNQLQKLMCFLLILIVCGSFSFPYKKDQTQSLENDWKK